MARGTVVVRLPIPLKQRVDEIANSERRNKQEALCILIEEAIAARAKA